MNDKTLKVGKKLNFASVEDLIAVSNGEMPMEEAERRYSELQDKSKVKGYMTVTKIENGNITIGKQ